MNPAEVLERVGGNEALLRELIELFLEEYPGCLDEGRDGLRQGDLPRVRRSAHLLRGSVDNFATLAAYEAARHIETCARNGDLAAALAAWPALEEELRRFVTDLGRLLARLQADVHPEEILT